MAGTVVERAHFGQWFPDQRSFQNPLCSEAMCRSYVSSIARAVAGLMCLFGSACASRELANLPEVDAGVLCTSCGSCAEMLPIEGTPVHVTGDIEYTQIPPVGGPHRGCWADWGVAESELPAGRWVHNLEHGGVVLLYRCDDCEAELESLRAFVREHPRTLLSSYAQLPTRFAAVSWGHRLLSDCFDPELFLRFYETRVARAPESLDAPPPSNCARSPEL